MNLKSTVCSVVVIFVRILARDPDKRPVAILIAGRNAKRRPTRATRSPGGPGKGSHLRNRVRYKTRYARKPVSNQYVSGTGLVFG